MDVDTLPDDPQLLKQIILNFAQEKRAIEQKVDELQQMIAWFRRKMFGPRSEKINDNQLLLFGQSLMPLSTPAPEAQMPVEVRVNRPRGHGRRVIPENLPREILTIDLPEEQKPCPQCGTERQVIGEEVTEQLEFIPAKLFVRRFIRPKYACGICEANIAIADKPQQVVEKGLAGPGLIAHIATSKYADHLPLYRIEGIFARYGIELSRSTMCDWMGDVARLAHPLVELMHQRILQSKVIHTDDTTVPVQDVGKTKTGRLWVYIGDESSPYNLYQYTPNRKKEHPKAYLGEYSGYLQADAYGGYDDVYRTGMVKEVACWAHARRKFFEAREKSPEICRQALELIKRLYVVEEQGKDLEPRQRLELRQQQSLLILNELEAWLHKTRGELLPKNPAAEAVTYTLNQWEALKRYTQQPFLAIDNNVAEREMRPVALGRKNWLFAGSDEGGRTAATLYSLIRSAQRHGLNVEYYLRSIFAHLPGTKLSELPHLLPEVWKGELADEQARAQAVLRP